MKRQGLREQVGSKLIEWAHRIRRKPYTAVYGVRREIGIVHDDWQSPNRGFLVYGSCSCGWWAATAEGGLWPHCPNCGKQVMPPKPGPGNPHGRLGFSAKLLPEPEALKRSEDA